MEVEWREGWVREARWVGEMDERCVPTSSLTGALVVMGGGLVEEGVAEGGGSSLTVGLVSACSAWI